MTWTDLSAAFGYGTKLTSAQMQQLRDNIAALANGDTNAPSIQSSAYDSFSVIETKVDSGAITEYKLGNGAVTENKIGTGAVTENKIGTGAVTTYKLGNDSVWENRILDRAVTNTKVDSGAITLDHISNSYKDPAAGTYGLRTLGTASTAACAGNDSRLSYYEGIGLPNESIETDQTTGENTTYLDFKTHNIRIPDRGATLYMRPRVKFVNPGGYYCQVRFLVNSTASSVISFANTGFEWTEECSLDVSGNQNTNIIFCIQMRCANHATADFALQGYSVRLDD